MMKSIIFILLIIPYLSFSQIDEEDYAIYRKVINEQLGFGVSEKVDSLVLIERYEAKFPPEMDFIDELTTDSISRWTISYLYTQTYGNEEFIQKLINDPELKNALREFQNGFQDHPKLDAGSLRTGKLHFQTIRSRKYYSFFGRKFKKIEKGWMKR